MFELLTVCTGNICRSPLAELVLRTRLAGLPGAASSAGMAALDSAPMPEEAKRLAAELGVPEGAVLDHRSQQLTPAILSTPDLVLAMSREHRRYVVELDPSRLRSCFTVREFARLALDTLDEEIHAAATPHTDAGAKVRAAVAAVAANRGASAPPADPADDDVVDPYKRSWDTYQRSADQLMPALEQVIRVIQLASSNN